MDRKKRETKSAEVTPYRYSFSSGTTVKSHMRENPCAQ
jgi:hypothetical protein